MFQRHLSISTTNALVLFDDFLQGIGDRQLVVFLDYDGTLTPIVNDPEKALLSRRMHEILIALQKEFITGVISGRSLTKLRNFVGIEGLYYAGSHGFDIIGPNGTSIRNQVALEFLPTLGHIRDTLREKLIEFPGANVEDNAFSISVHYRNVDPEFVPRIKELVSSQVQQNPGIRMGNGKKVFELKPKILWDKGKALVWLLKALRLNRDDVYTIYIGDDTTDEDAFDVFSEQSDTHGVGLVVTEESMDSRASYTLQSPEQVGVFLEKLIAFSKQRDTMQSIIT